MAYTLKYYNEFTSDYFQRLVRVEIYERDYLGTSEQIKMGASIHLSNSGDGRGEPIKKLTASLRLLSTKNFQFEHLFTADDKKYKVIIIRDSRAVFDGFLESDSYSEPYYSWKNYTVNITARDNLGRLDDIPFLDDNGDRYTGLTSVWIILQRALSKTGLTLPVAYSYLNLKSSDMGVGGPLTQSYINNDTFWNFEDNEPESCLYVVTEILKGFCSQIRKVDGSWEITDQAEYYNRPTVQGNSATYPTYLADVLNFPEVEKSFLWINKDADMSILPAWKSFSIVQDYKVPERIIEVMPELTDFTPSGSHYTVDNWDSNSGFFGHNGSTRYISPVSLNITDERLWAKTYVDLPIIDRNIKFEFSVWSLGFNGDLVDIYVDIINDDLILTSTGWVTYTNQEKQLKFDLLTSASSEFSFTTLSVTASGIPNTGGFTIKIWGAKSSLSGYYSPLVIEDIIINLVASSSNNIIPLNANISASINELNNLTYSDIDINICQVPSEIDSALIYLGGLFTSAGVAQTDWKRTGDATTKDLLEQVAIGYDLHNKQPSRQVNGTVLWDYDIWTNIDDQNKRLMINSIGEWDMNTDQMNAEWVEVFEYKNTLGAFDSGFDDGFDNSDSADYTTDTTFEITESYE